MLSVFRNKLVSVRFINSLQDITSSLYEGGRERDVLKSEVVLMPSLWKAMGSTSSLMSESEGG